ncbi:MULTISPECIES: DUF2157 domain-containing protein [unclassified Spirosoma]|uniref:DUF2157 domain-containing protein n=1 Tax=unclassified Spirosoma TaxID=2621999 RepID=UPI0009631B16|nr:MULTISPECIES: DUF2157 domain-containing protein [unclassified Spirosoma]MBN8825322.1 DUF2157 domain-containing protein [Spirosoma sp.]OJW77507.1 MAG: hypothetical protein BGO59_01180 [Spirosoma sp. 48-14]
MSPSDILAALNKQGILPTEQQAKMAEIEQKKPFSVHWELRSMLYIGILLLSSGLGLLVYDNFDQIGHGALLAAIAIACFGSFFFAWRYRPDWTLSETKSRSTFGDYALILACLLFLTLEGYAQYAYNVFGGRYGLVTLLPALLFLPIAYRFDHRGILGMALTALISWVGVTVRPLELYFKTNFFDRPTVFSAIGLSLVLIALAFVLQRRKIKAHFTYTYLTMAGNLLMVALLGGLFNFEELRIGFAVGLAAACVVLDRFARQEQSFLFLLMSVVYGYIGATYLFFYYLHLDDEAYYWYFILTGIALVYYLMSQLPKRNAK